MFSFIHYSSPAGIGQAPNGAYINAHDGKGQ